MPARAPSATVEIPDTPTGHFSDDITTIPRRPGQRSYLDVSPIHRSHPDSPEETPWPTTQDGRPLRSPGDPILRPSSGGAPQRPEYPRKNATKPRTGTKLSVSRTCSNPCRKRPQRQTAPIKPDQSGTTQLKDQIEEINPDYHRPQFTTAFETLDELTEHLVRHEGVSQEAALAFVADGYAFSFAQYKGELLSDYSTAIVTTD